MDLSPPTSDRFTLRFRDPVWEAAFWADAAPEHARQMYANSVPLLAGYLSFAVFYATRSTWPVEARVGTTAAALAGAVVCVAFMAWSRTGHFRRHVHLAYFAYPVLHTIAVYAALAAAPQWVAQEYGLAMAIVALFRSMQVSNLPIGEQLAISVVQIATYLLVIPGVAGLDTATTLGHAAALLVSFGVGVSRMRDNHAVVRREYVYRTISERLVEATLPRTIAARLKSGERTIADPCSSVSVLFADLVGFTPLTRRIGAQELATLLDAIFTRFDAVAAEHGVEKIKTIGDCYMAAAGVPESAPDHARRAARMALAMREIIADVSRESGHDIRLRIGLDSGPAVAGILGRNKLVYDLWGDVVNTASRMESHGEPDAIQISDRFREELGSVAIVRDRGVIEVKGKGPMRTWLLDGLQEVGSVRVAK